MSKKQEKNLQERFDEAAKLPNPQQEILKVMNQFIGEEKKKNPNYKMEDFKETQELYEKLQQMAEGEKLSSQKLYNDITKTKLAQKVREAQNSKDKGYEADNEEDNNKINA